MDLRALRYFGEVVTQGGFTRAAESLNVTQPTISKMIRQLEDESGFPLLVRGPNSIQMTEAGQILNRHTKEILRQFAGLRSDLDSLKGLIHGELRFAFPPPLAGGRYFTRELGQFHKLYPGITLKIQELGGVQILTGVEAGDWDLGVVAAVEDDPKFDRLPLFDDHLDIVVPANSPWAGKQISLAEMANERFVVFPSDFSVSDIFHQACRAHGFTPNVACNSGQWEFLIGLVEAGVGVVPLPSNLHKRVDPNRLGVATLVPQVTCNMEIIWRKGGYPSFATKAFLELMRESMAGGNFQIVGKSPILSC